MTLRGTFCPAVKATSMFGKMISSIGKTNRSAFLQRTLLQELQCTGSWELRSLWYFDIMWKGKLPRTSCCMRTPPESALIGHSFSKHAWRESFNQHWLCFQVNLIPNAWSFWHALFPHRELACPSTVTLKPMMKFGSKNYHKISLVVTMKIPTRCAPAPFPMTMSLHLVALGS